MVKEELELFIGQVDARLLKAVLLEVLKPEYIENADLTLLVRGDDVVGNQQLVDLVHDPAE